MTTPQVHRIERLEARRGGAEVTRMVAYVAAANGVSPSSVIAEAERLLRETAGMTEAERTERLAADLGQTVAEVETALAGIAADVAAWQGQVTP